MVSKLCRDQHSGEAKEKKKKSSYTKNNCFPQTSPTQCECVTVFRASHARSLAHVTAAPTHISAFIHLQITALTALRLLFGNRDRSKHYSTGSSLTVSVGGVSGYSSAYDHQTTLKVLPCLIFCRHKQEAVPARCIIQTRIAL